MKRTMLASLLSLAAISAFAETPPIVTEALRSMNAAPTGWAFTQTTV